MAPEELEKSLSWASLKTTNTLEHQRKSKNMGQCNMYGYINQGLVNSDIFTFACSREMLFLFVALSREEYKGKLLT